MEPVLFYYGAFILVSLLQLASSRVDSYGGWNQAPDTQYHIQTDEGDERYFKYQTKTGQYRKEKRLQDGTVIGTYGWVDANGNLRLQDYMADNSGYHVLKSRMLFVGDTNDIGSSVAAAKNVPPTGGELVSPNNSPFNTYAATPNRAIYVPPMPSRNPYQTPVSPTPIPIPQHAPVTPASTYLTNVGPQYFPTSTPSPVQHYTASPSPTLYYPSSTPASVQVYQSSTPSYFPSSTQAPAHYYPSSTPQVDINLNAEPNFVYSPTPAPSTHSSMRPIVVYSVTDRPIQNQYVSPGPDTVTPSPTISAIGYTASTPSPQVRPSPIAGKYANPVNNFITETEKNKQFYEYERNRGYYKRYVNTRPREQDYDGISTVQNGFRYYLPKMYHEEQSSRDGSDKTGSFGYVDPFGIRRVVYYNAAPGRGFVHRKNNRYVGHNAAPYDPRPT